MADFTPLYAGSGSGDFHFNRFRIGMRGNARDVPTIGANLVRNMPAYMDERSASVRADSHEWNGLPTLEFRGVARLRPFSVPVIVTLPPLIGGGTIEIPVPESVRDWAIPDLHTDSVGVHARSGQHFVAQTLKREYETGDDTKIRALVATVVVPAITAAGTLGALPGAIAGALTGTLLALLLGNIAVEFNRAHFLAGRRSFHFNHGSAFGYSDGRLVFETAAIEQLSSRMIAASMAVMGEPKDVVRPVWVQMVQKFARAHGLRVITGERPGSGWQVADNAVHYLQQDHASLAGLVRDPHARNAIATHPGLH